MKRRALWCLMFVYSSSIGLLVWLYLVVTGKTRVFYPFPLIARTARRHADEVIA